MQLAAETRLRRNKSELLLLPVYCLRKLATIRAIFLYINTPDVDTVNPFPSD